METILLIDDEPNILNVYSLMLEKKGYRILKAHDGNAGLNALLSEDVDLIISDIYMPQKNGLVLIKQIRRILKYRNIPIIILSAVGTKENVFRGIELSVDAFLAKPCTKEKLYETVEKLLKLNGKAFYENGKGDNKSWQPEKEISIMLVYKNARVTDNLYEFLSERFSKVFIEEDTKDVKAMMSKENIDLLVIEVSDSQDENFKFLFHRYDKIMNIEVPTIIITDSKKDLEPLFDCFEFKVDRIINKPFKYEDLTKSIFQVTETGYLRRKMENSTRILKKRIKENTENESKHVNTLRNEITQLKSENAKLISNKDIFKDKKFQIINANNEKINDITKKISRINKKFLNERQNIIEAVRNVNAKLKSLNKIHSVYAALPEKSINN